MFVEHEPKLELNSGNHSFFDGNKKAAQLQAAFVLFSPGLERVKKNSNYLSTAMEETSLTIFH
jgi:hypothetical protein